MAYGIIRFIFSVLSVTCLGCMMYCTIRGETGIAIFMFSAFIGSVYMALLDYKGEV